jgi:hypothetical protein
MEISIQYNNFLECECCGSRVAENEWYNSYNLDTEEEFDLIDIVNATCLDRAMNFLQICPICGYVSGLEDLDAENNMDIIEEIVSHPNYQMLFESDMNILYKKWRLLLFLAVQIDDSCLIIAICCLKLYDIITELDLDISFENFEKEDLLDSTAECLISYLSDDMDDEMAGAYIILIIDTFRRLQDKENFFGYIAYIEANMIEQEDDFSKHIENEIKWFENKDFTKKELFILERDLEI